MTEEEGSNCPEAFYLEHKTQIRSTKSYSGLTDARLEGVIGSEGEKFEQTSLAAKKRTY